MNENSVSFRMERNEHILPPGAVTFEITDDTGHTVILNPQRAYELLQWLYDRREELHTVVTREQEPTTGEHEAL